MSGEALGFGYASDEKRLTVTPWSYQLGIVSLVAPAKAAALFDDQGGGLPERMVFAPGWPSFVPDPDNADEMAARPADPGPMTWSPPSSSAVTDLVKFERGALRVAADVRAIIDRERLLNRRTRRVADLDVHRGCNQLRVAVPLAWLHGSDTVEMTHYKLAEAVMRVSDEARAWLQREIRAEANERNDASDRRAAQRATTVAGAVDRQQETRRLERTVNGARKAYDVVEAGKADTVRDVRRRVRHESAAEWWAMLTHAVDAEWLVEYDDPTGAGGVPARRLRVGPRRPT